MSGKSLPVPFSLQKEDGYCLPACVEMVLAYLGIKKSQDELGKELGLRPYLGVPAFKIKELTSSRLFVTYGVGTVAEINAANLQGIPVIAFVEAGELPHWHGRKAQHAVVVTGLIEQKIALLDPAMEEHPILVSIDDFLLGWFEMDNRYATIQLRE